LGQENKAVTQSDQHKRFYSLFKSIHYLKARQVAYYEYPAGLRRFTDIEYATEDAIYALVDASIACTFIDGVKREDNLVIMEIKLKSPPNDPPVGK
jgi:hypothetical protein